MCYVMLKVLYQIYNHMFTFKRSHFVLEANEMWYLRGVYINSWIPRLPVQNSEQLNVNI